MAGDTARLEIELQDSASSGQGGGASGFVGFGSETGLVSGLSNLHPAVAIITTAVSALADGVMKVKDTALDMAQELRPYSGNVASAYAQNEVDRINMLLERDARIGDQLAQLVRSQNAFDMAWEDLRTEVMRVLIPALNSMMRWGIEDGVPILQEMLEITTDIYTYLTTWDKGEVIMNRIERAFQRHWDEEKAKEAAGQVMGRLTSFLEHGAKGDLWQSPGFKGKNIPGGLF